MRHRFSLAVARLALLALCLHVPSGAFCCRGMAMTAGPAIARDGAGTGHHPKPDKAPAGDRHCRVCKALCAQAALPASPPVIALGTPDHGQRQWARTLHPGADAVSLAFLARGPPGAG